MQKFNYNPLPARLEDNKVIADFYVFLSGVIPKEGKGCLFNFAAKVIEDGSIFKYILIYNTQLHPINYILTFLIRNGSQR